MTKEATETIRDYNDYSIHEFLVRLSMETWDEVFAGNNTNIVFNKFLDTYLKIFNTCFKKKTFTPHIHITLG